MKRRFFLSAIVIGAGIFAMSGLDGSGVQSAQAQSAKQETNLENTLYLDLKDGRVTIKMRPDLAPNHVARIKELVREGFYDGIVFHRVIDGFMAQTGDPTGTGRGGSGQNLDAEFSLENHKRGVLSMARSQDPNSADSQFFIVFDDSSFLDNQYTVWGEVSDGMDLVDKIKRGAEGSGAVDDPDKIVKMQVAADADK
jgi:peptidylprolyl isomerase